LQLNCIYPSFHVKVNNDFEPFATAVEKTGWWLHPPLQEYESHWGAASHFFGWKKANFETIT
jgi:hypothetical protein